MNDGTARSTSVMARSSSRTARLEDLTDHPVAVLLSHDLADEIRELIDSDSYSFTGSPGRGKLGRDPMGGGL
jgi:hypothetical protein